MTDSQKLDDILATLDNIKLELADIKAGGTNKTGASAYSTGGAIADAADLDSQYGDPEVFRDPPRWTGASFAKKKMSQCPSDYLMSLAGFMDWQADKDGASGDPQKIKYAGYRRKDAARARGWAKRNEGKDLSRTEGTDPGRDETDELPF